MTTKIVSPKAPAEEIRVTFDFAEILAGSAITGIVSVECEVEAGTDAAPSAMISGAASDFNGIVSQKIIGGTAGNDYRLTCVVTTSDGRKLAVAMILPVRKA